MVEKTCISSWRKLTFEFILVTQPLIKFRLNKSESNHISWTILSRFDERLFNINRRKTLHIIMSKVVTKINNCFVMLFSRRKLSFEFILVIQPFIKFYFNQWESNYISWTILSLFDDRLFNINRRKNLHIILSEVLTQIDNCFMMLFSRRKLTFEFI